MLGRLRSWLRRESPREDDEYIEPLITETGNGENLGVLPEHESAVRSMMAEAHGGSYTAFRSLSEAKARQGGSIVLEGDYGGQIYVTSPAKHVSCDEATLDRLVLDLDRVAWPDSEGAGAKVYFEVIPIGGGVAGGMGGAPLIDDIWVHDEFVELGMEETIRAVVRGDAQALTRG